MVDLTPARPSRRAVLGAGAALGAAVPLLVTGTSPAVAAAPQNLPGGSSAAARSARSALTFLQQVTDAYATKGFRLAQSYDDSRISDIGFIYDNALTCMALLAAGDVTRARAIGDALLYAQDHDPEQDGRLRQSYHVGAFVNADKTPNPGWEFGLTGTAVGDMAWTGLALAQLAHRTGKAT